MYESVSFFSTIKMFTFYKSYSIEKMQFYGNINITQFRIRIFDNLSKFAEKVKIIELKKGLAKFNKKR